MWVVQWSALVIAVFLLFAASTGLQAQGARMLRIFFASPPNLMDVVCYRAIDLLQEQGVRVNVGYMEGGAGAVQAVLAGRADVASGGPEDGINANLMAFGVCRPTNQYMIMARPGIMNLQSLNGRIFGVSDPNGADAIAARLVLQKNGVDLNLIKWSVVGGVTARGAALLAGRIDASALFGEAYLRVYKAGYPRLAIVADHFPTLGTVFTAHKGWLDRNSDLALALVRAHRQASEWFYTSKIQWMALGARRVPGIDVDIAGQTYDMLVEMKMYKRAVTPEIAEQTMRFLVEGGGVRAPKPLKEWFTFEFLQKAQ